MFDVTVTFDNGPEPSVTPRVLDVLARRGVRTTFFVIGNKLLTRDARACTERAHAEGHWIGNHTWTHSRPLGERPGAATADPGDRAHAGRDRRSVALRPTVPTHRWRRPPGPPAAESGRGGAAQGRRLHLRAVERDPARLGGPGGLGRDRACATRAAILDADGAARLRRSSSSVGNRSMTHVAARAVTCGRYSAAGSGGLLPARVSLSHCFQASVS